MLACFSRQHLAAQTPPSVGAGSPLCPPFVILLNLVPQLSAGVEEPLAFCIWAWPSGSCAEEGLFSTFLISCLSQSTRFLRALLHSLAGLSGGRHGNWPAACISCPAVPWRTPRRGMEARRPRKCSGSRQPRGASAGKGRTHSGALPRIWELWADALSLLSQRLRSPFCPSPILC